MQLNKGTLRVFRNRTYRALWLASLTSNFGGLVQTVGAAWLMTSLSSSQSMVALVQTSVTLPVMIVSLAAGVLADSFDRRVVMLAAQGFMLTISVVLAILALQHMLTPWILLSFTFLIGCGTALHNPSWQASVSDIVTRDDLPAAVSLNAMGMNLTRSLGPAAGGAIVAVAGAAAAFAVNALSYLAIIAALYFWKPPQRERHLPRERFGGAMAAGLRYLAMSPQLMKAIARAALFSFAAIALQALLPLVVRDRLHGTALTFGLLLGGFGFGAVIAALNSVRLRSFLKSEQITRFGIFGYAAATLTLAFTQATIINAAAMFIAGACWISVLSLVNVTVQMTTPRWVLGRMMSLYLTGIFGGMAAGSWFWGAVSDAYGMFPSLAGAAAVLVGAAVLGYWAPTPQIGRADLDPLDRFNEPALRLALNRQSGPIAILVEYEIAQADVPEFLLLMNQRRRNRLRDGARRWSILRDLETPDRWIESFHFPTWIEYLRHRERRTQTDVAFSTRLLGLHRGPKPLQVHRMIERQVVSDSDNMPRRDDP